MATWRQFEDIEAWQKARELNRAIYACSKVSRFFRDRALREQIRRAAVSIMANVAEGFERSGNKEFIQFLSMAKGSAGEVESLLYIALDQEYVTQQQFVDLKSQVRTTKSLIGGLISYLRRSQLKGSKYRKSGTRHSNAER